MRSKVLGLLGAVVMIVLAGCRVGDSAQAAAYDVVNGTKLRGQTVQAAVSHRDAILEPLRRESRDYSDLSGEATIRIAETLAAIRTPASEAALRQLYDRSQVPAKVIGAMGLVAHGRSLDADGERTLRRIVVAALLPHERAAAMVGEGGEKAMAADRVRAWRELAMRTLAEMHSQEAVPDLIRILDDREATSIHPVVCEALARIGDNSAVPALREAMRSRTFEATAPAFRALITLGDKQGVPLAIERIDAKREEYTGGTLVAELRKVTGEDYGIDQARWRSWWNSVNDTWEIPRSAEPAAASAGR